MGLLKRWRQRRQAQSEARAYLVASRLSATLPAVQQRDLLQLRAFFFREQMGTWPERVALYVAASGLPLAACIVEVGSWVGVGTCYLACGLRAGGGGRVYAVDTFRGTTLDPRAEKAWADSVAKLGGSARPVFDRNVTAFQLDSLVVPIQEESVKAAARWTGPQIDLLYIDGDHVYEAVRADFEAWCPLVGPEAVVIFHDYDDWHPGVRRLVDEALGGPLHGHATEQVGSLLTVRLGRGEHREPGPQDSGPTIDGR